MENKPSIEVPQNQDIKKIKSDVKITVTDSAIEVFDEGKVQRFLRPREGEPMDYVPVERFLADVRAKYPAKRDMLIFATDAAFYEDVVAVMDRSLAQRFPELIVTGQEQKQ